MNAHRIMSIHHTTPLFTLLALFCFWGMFLWIIPTAYGANLYFTPQSADYRPGETAVLELRIDNEGECINAADVVIAFPKEQIEAIDVSRGDSIFTVWVSPPAIHQDLGIITLVGGIPGGYCGRAAGDPAITNVIAKFVFHLIEDSYAKPIETRITVLEDSKVVLHDGVGTPARVASRPATILIDTASPPNDNAWTQELQDDTSPPEAFTIIVLRENTVFKNKYFAVWNAIDKQTGIERYEVLETQQGDDPAGQSGWRIAESPFMLTDQSLSSSIFIRAIDKAGNERIEEYVPAERSGVPWWERVALLLIASLTITFLVIYKVFFFLLLPF